MCGKLYLLAIGQRSFSKESTATFQIRMHDKHPFPLQMACHNLDMNHILLLLRTYSCVEHINFIRFGGHATTFDQTMGSFIYD